MSSELEPNSLGLPNSIGVASNTTDFIEPPHRLSSPCLQVTSQANNGGSSSCNISACFPSHSRDSECDLHLKRVSTPDEESATRPVECCSDQHSSASRLLQQRPTPQSRPFRRRASHTLLYVPEDSGIAAHLCDTITITRPSNIDEDSMCCSSFYINHRRKVHRGTPHKATTPRRESVQLGAPAVALKSMNSAEKRVSAQPPPNSFSSVSSCFVNSSPFTSKIDIFEDSADEAAGNNNTNIASDDRVLTKRVSWLSMDSFQDSFKPLLLQSRRNRRRSGLNQTIANSSPTRNDSRPSSQYGSTAQLDDNSVLDDDTPPLDTISWDAQDEYENVTLMYAKHEKIPMKDFGSEIRATMDIDHLLNKSVLLLDLQETSLEEIFAKIIHEMDIQEPEFTSEQVRSVLFTQDSGNQFHILSRTVQSICTTGAIGGTFDYDQTWICAL
ncbi:hypothetical protein AB6A40_002406 [Gnathostoma spinigerum]|uniref:Uncharacterized protein n=1 Tax=Gnathostoma spinigerum TaxID=75299 RepID=A0ABD6EGL7_9BILA